MYYHRSHNTTWIVLSWLMKPLPPPSSPIPPTVRYFCLHRLTTKETPTTNYLTHRLHLSRPLTILHGITREMDTRVRYWKLLLFCVWPNVLGECNTIHCVVQYVIFYNRKFILYDRKFIFNGRERIFCITRKRFVYWFPYPKSNPMKMLLDLLSDFMPL